MSNLTPQKRPDKNGRMVTRHVKTGVTSDAAARIPQPQISQRDEAADRKLVAFASQTNPDQFLRSVQAAKPDLVKLLNDFHESEKTGYVTREVADYTARIIEAARKTKHVNRYAENLTTHFDFMRTLECGDENGLMLMSGLIDVEDRITGPLTERQQQAVMKVTKAMVLNNKHADPFEDYELRLRNDIYHLAVTDEELVRMVVGTPEMDERIAAAVSAGVLRAGQIKAALDDNIQQPLLGGAL